MSDLNAKDSYLGYIFQGNFALVALSKEEDDDATVSVESTDDVFTSNSKVDTLHQLKHSLGSPPDLNEKNIGFWKAIGHWANEPKFINRRKFVFITCASISNINKFKNFGLLKRSNKDNQEIQNILEQEANRVIQEVKTGKYQHKDRIKACEKFISLNNKLRQSLITNIHIKPDSYTILDTKDELSKELNKLISPKFRDEFYERLLGWWDRRIALGLSGQLNNEIHKSELTGKIAEILNEIYEDRLSDDFSEQDPDESTVKKEFGTNMEKQIDLVKGGEARLYRSAKNRWKSRNQRELWVRKDLSIAYKLINFDKTLKSEWQDKFEPMCEDLLGEKEEKLQEYGKKILDWTHEEAPSKIETDLNFPKPFLIRGTYQQLADELKVGWHPNYKEHLNNEK